MNSLFPYQALYIHVPFCACRCNYCDFETQAVAPDDQRLDDFVASIRAELVSASREYLLDEIKTIYIGGGTPSHLGAKRLFELIDTVCSHVKLTEDTEFTVEANPESFSDQIAERLCSLGVNRLSLGVQSFVDSELLLLGRIHDADTSERALKSACEHMPAVSVDLICGIPGQNNTSWLYSLNKAILSGIKHISVYPLTLEEDTPLAGSVASGFLPKPDEDFQASCMEAAEEMLLAAGFEHYEIASYALPGFRCRHNMAYWTGIPYLGLGKGAAGMRVNGQHRERLLERNVTERLGREEALLEDIMLGMRIRDGVSINLVEKAYAFVPQLADVLTELIACGLVVFEDGHYCPTSRGWLLGNEIFSRIWLCRQDSGFERTE